MLSPAATLYLSLRALVPIVGVQEPTTARFCRGKRQPGAPFCLIAGLSQGPLRPRILYYLAIGRSFWYKTQLFFELDPLLR